MKTTSALLGIIGGLLGIVTGYWTQTVGGINSFFEIDNADTTIVIGKIVIVLSMAIIILSCFIFKRPKFFGAIILVLGISTTILGNLISGTMVVAGGVIGLLSQHQATNKKHKQISFKKLPYRSIFMILGSILLMCILAFGIYKIVLYYKIANANARAKEGISLVDKEEYKVAIPYLLDAALSGNEQAQFNLAICYDKMQRMDSCLYWLYEAFPKSKDAGEMLFLKCAQIAITDTYPEYKQDAFDVLSLAAENSNIAQYGLARLYQYGEGTKTNYDKAFYWYKRAAENGLNAIVGLNTNVEIGYFNYKVTDFEYRKSVGRSFYRETSDGLYLIIYVSITNIDTESRYAVTKACFLTDEHDNKYEPDDDASVALATSGYNNFAMKIISPNITSRGIIVFEVPHKGKYYLHVSGGFWDDKYAPILLKKN